MSKVFAVSGIKNSGKTTLVSKLVTALTEKGYKVGVIKHDGHEFKADHEGTDSYKHKAAGAQNVIVYSKTKLMMIKDLQLPNIHEMIALQDEMDIVILEGMKYSSFPKIEVVRRAISNQIVCDPSTLLAIATDVPMQVGDIPIIPLDDFEKILDVVLNYIHK
nr:molybdopterin-guanine dinucleotide biosynthesis protein B [uncultured Cellulosilyticum sp.]